MATDYIESQTGRLFAATDFHLQNAPREVRKIALAGYWDYDFRDCHYSILQQLAHRYGVAVPAIDNYVADAQTLRALLSDELALEACLIALIYGATASHRVEDAIPELVGLEKARELYAHPRFCGLMEEVKVTGKAVIENAERLPQKDKPIVNAMRKKIDANELWRSILAHLMQGIEAQMLHTMVEIYPEEILLLQHNEWTADRALDIGFIEDEIARETGFKMDIEIEFLDP